MLLPSIRFSRWLEFCGGFFLFVLFIHFWLHCTACSILVPQAAIKPCPLQWKYRVLITGLLENSLEFCVFLIPQMTPQSAARLFAFIQHDDELSLDSVAFHTHLPCLTMCLNFFVFISIFLLK